MFRIALKRGVPSAGFARTMPARIQPTKVYKPLVSFAAAHPHHLQQHRRGIFSSISNNFRRGGNLGGGNPLAALWAIMGVNLLVALDWSFHWPLSINAMHKHFLASTYYLFSPDWYMYLHTLFTSCVSHIEPWHLFANMFTLYFFAGDIFMRYGAKFGVTLYFVSGALATLTALGHARFVEHTHYRVLGASGAVCAFVSLGILLNPTQIVLVWFVVPVPAALFGVGYILKEVWGAKLPLGMSGESHVAHLAGSAVGLLAYSGLRRVI